MKILSNRNVGIRGQGYEAGETLDVDASDAKILITMGKAQIAPEVAVEVVAEEADEQPKAKAAKHSAKAKAE